MRKTHCKRGHAFTSDNTAIYDGKRMCKACDRLRHRWLSGSTVTRPSPICGSTQDRLDAYTMPIPECGCLVWMGQLSKDGYGRIKIDGKSYMTHRISYELENGPIPEGLTLDHLCRVRSCRNAAHLEPVTMRENTLRGVTLPAINAKKTHCSRGHEYSGKNLYINPRKGNRQCRICERDNRRRRLSNRSGENHI